MTENIDTRPIRIRVHPLLVEELEIRKQNIEEETGHKLDGGVPTISYLAAVELKKIREVKNKGMDKKNIKVTLQRIKGTNKNGIIDIEL